MDFQYSDEETAIAQMASQFAQEHIKEHAKSWDEHSFFPRDVFQKAAELGLVGMNVRTEHGGAGLSRLSGVLVYEQWAQACISTAAFLSIHNMVCGLIDVYGTDEQRAAWLPRLLRFDSMASYCLTEPGSGSDAASLKTKALAQGDDYLINGSKSFISGGSVSDWYACMVRTGGDDHRGISCVFVEKNTPGLTFGPLEKKLGWNSQPTSMVFFEDCRVPRTHRLGDEGQGFKIALNALNGGRVNIAACSLGGAKACIELARQYVSERQQFGKALQEFQNIQFNLADMYTQYEAARLMVLRAAWSLDVGHAKAPVYCAMAKQFASEAAFEISDKALQMLGGYGYLKDYPVERYFRDLRVHRILEGTNEMMRLIIARDLLSQRDL